MKNKKKKNIVIIILQITIIIMLQMVLIRINKSDIKLDKVKLKEIAAYDNSNVSIMIYNDDTSEYEKYTGESFPSKSEYVYSEEDSKCLDVNGVIIEGAIKYFNGKVTIKTNKTSTCYLSFRPGKALTFELGEGVAKVYYKVNNDEEYIESEETTVVAVTPGTEYTYYGEAETGYILSACTSEEDICSETMPNEAKTETISAGRSKIIMNEGVGEIYYKLSDEETYNNSSKNVVLTASSGTYEYYGLPSAGYKISTCTKDVPCTVTIESGVTDKEITSEAITNTNGAIYLMNLAESNTNSNLIKQTGLEITVQTGYNATTDYRYIGNGQCSYDNGNYIGVEVNGICSTLYNYTRTQISNNKKTDYTYQLTCPENTSSYTYECTSFEGIKINNNGPNNYVCLGNLQSNGQCIDEEHLYRIIGVIPTQTTKSGGYENRIKLIKSTSYIDNDISTDGKYYWTGQKARGGGNYTSYTGASANYNNWEESTLNRVVLNQTYYNSLDEKYQNMIGNTVWYLGGCESKSGVVATYYQCERTEKSYGNNPKYTEQKIGLMYPSDYGYATMGKNGVNGSTCINTDLNDWYPYEDCRNNDWMFIPKFSQWAINQDSDYYWSAYHLNYQGNVGIQKTFEENAIVRPVFHLIYTTKILSGTGSINSPYTLSS